MKIETKVSAQSYWYNSSDGRQVKVVQGADFSGINRALDSLEQKVGRRVLITGIRAGAKVFRDASAARVPVRVPRSGHSRMRRITAGTLYSGLRAPGYLKRGVVFRTATQRGVGATVTGGQTLGGMRASVGARRSAFYGNFLLVGRRSRRMPIRQWLKMTTADIRLAEYMMRVAMARAVAKARR